MYAKIFFAFFLIVGILLLQVTLSALLLFKINTLEQQIAILSVSSPVANSESPKGVTRVEGVSVDDDPALGSPDAKVTIVEFSDFGCPFCAQFHKQVFLQLKAQYIDTGQVRFVYRDFPIIQLHPQAARAAEAAECAKEQGKFWEYHDELFLRQNEWQKETDSTELFKRYARNLSLDETKFGECVASDKYLDEVQNDSKDGIQYGVEGTPYFYVNGRKIQGLISITEFVALIDKELQ